MSAQPNAQLQPPENFDVRRPDEWPRWKRRFEQYLVATGLDKGEEARKVSILLYCLGVEGDDVLTSTGCTVDERKSYSTVMEKLDGHYKARRNVIFERARFNRRDQAKEETAEQYISALYTLVETCQYGALKEEMIRDRLVIGVRDPTLSDKLQMDPTLTLEKAKTAVLQKEASKEHRKQLKGSGTKEDPLLWKRSDRKVVVVEVQPTVVATKALKGEEEPTHNLVVIAA